MLLSCNSGTLYALWPLEQSRTGFSSYQSHPSIFVQKFSEAAYGCVVQIDPDPLGLTAAAVLGEQPFSFGKM